MGEFRCEKCGRRAGPEMIACPERPADACPYAFEEVSSSKGGCLVATGIAFALAALVFVLGVSQGDGMIALAAALAALGLGAAGVFGVFTLLSDSAPMLLNQDTGASWTRVSLLGRTFSEQITFPPCPVLIDDAPLLDLSVPPSTALLDPEIAARGSEAEVRQHARDVLELTLAALIGQQALTLEVSASCSAYLNRPVKLTATRYLLEPGLGADAVSGALEERLVRTAAEWRTRCQEERARLLSPGVNWRFPAPRTIEVHQLVVCLYDADPIDPYRWLIDLVHQDALARGVWERIPSDWRRGQTSYTVPQAHRVQAESQSIRALYDWLVQAQPVLMLAIRRQIEQGFRARQAG